MTAASSISQSRFLGVIGGFHGRAGIGDGARGLDEMPRLEALLVRIGRRRLAFLGRHRRGMVGVIGAGAEDGRRRRERREEFRLGERQPLDPALRRRGGGLLQRALGGAPMRENAHHGRVFRLAGELGGVEHLLADDQAGARPFARFIRRELVSRPLGPSHVYFSSFPKSDHISNWGQKAKFLAGSRGMKG